MCQLSSQSNRCIFIFSISLLICIDMVCTVRIYVHNINVYMSVYKRMGLHLFCNILCTQYDMCVCVCVSGFKYECTKVIAYVYTCMYYVQGDLCTQMSGVSSHTILVINTLSLSHTHTQKRWLCKDMYKKISMYTSGCPT